MVIVMINSAYYLSMALPSIDSIVIHGWQAPLVVKSSDETYGIIPSKSLPSMDTPSTHGWRISTRGMQHLAALPRLKRGNGLHTDD